MSARKSQMTASHEHAQRDTNNDNDFVRRRADDLEAEAAYYRNRAIQEEQALGPGYYVDLLRGMATDQAAVAHRMRTGKAATLSAFQRSS